MNSALGGAWSASHSVPRERDPELAGLADSRANLDVMEEGKSLCSSHRPNPFSRPYPVSVLIEQSQLIIFLKYYNSTQQISVLYK
jgi:hypothetical protein